MPPRPEVPPISVWTLRFFTRIVRRYFRRQFRSVMVQNLQQLRDARGPLIVYANHTSWWDPMILVLLAQTCSPAERHYAPMDASALARYPILRRIGIFPVEMTSARGAANFLRTSIAVLESGGVLWLTPQGRFADPRAWPLAFKPGLGALAARLPEVPVLPMAIEYTFWDERLPEALVRFGETVRVAAGGTAQQATQALEQALAGQMLALGADSMRRDASAFQTVMAGTRGVGGMYGFGRRLWAMVTRTRVQEDHTAREEH